MVDGLSKVELRALIIYAPFLISYGTSYDSLGQSLGQSSSGYVKNNYTNDSSQGKAGGSSNNTAAGSKCLLSLPGFSK